MFRMEIPNVLILFSNDILYILKLEMAFKMGVVYFGQVGTIVSQKINIHLQHKSALSV